MSHGSKFASDTPSNSLITVDGVTAWADSCADAAAVVIHIKDSTPSTDVVFARNWIMR